MAESSMPLAPDARLKRYSHMSMASATDAPVDNGMMDNSFPTGFDFESARTVRRRLSMAPSTDSLHTPAPPAVRPRKRGRAYMSEDLEALIHRSSVPSSSTNNYETPIDDGMTCGPLPHCGHAFPTHFSSKSTRRVRRCSRTPSTGDQHAPSVVSVSSSTHPHVAAMARVQRCGHNTQLLKLDVVLAHQFWNQSYWLYLLARYHIFAP